MERFYASVEQGDEHAQTGAPVIVGWGYSRSQCAGDLFPELLESIQSLLNAAGGIFPASG
jgi:hypothetical protein